MQKSQTGQPNTKDREKNVKKLPKSHKLMKRKQLQAMNIGGIVITLIMGDSTVSGLVERKMSRNPNVKHIFFSWR